MDTRIQDPRLRMIAQGFAGDSEAQDGNHLRWVMDPELGFPPEGFRLFFRPSSSSKPRTVLFSNLLPVGSAPFSALISGGVTVHDAGGELLKVNTFCNQRGLSLTERPLVVRFRPNLGQVPHIAREVSLLCVSRSGGAFARARFAGEIADCAGSGTCLNKLVPSDLLREMSALGQDELLLPGRFLRDEARRSDSPVTIVESARRRMVAQLLGPLAPALQGCRTFAITLAADAIDEVLVTGCGGTLLVGVQFQELLEDEAEGEWEQLAGPICLPIGSTSSYPCSEIPNDGRERAKLRLPEEADLPPLAPSLGELVDRLLGPDFDELQAGLSKMWEDPQPQYLQVQSFPSDDPEDPVTYDLQIVNEVLLGCLDPYFARVIGLYFVDNRSGGPWDYMVQAEWPLPADVLRLSWIAFGVQREPQPKPASPTGITATPIEGASRVAADGTVSRFQMDVGIRWNRPTACDLTDLLHAYTAYFVERTAADAPITGPFRIVNERIFDDSGAPEIVPLLLTDSQADETDFPLGYFIDPGPGYGQFHYRVLARDLFGRTSVPSTPATVDVRDRVSPPPPINLRALYFDPADPDLAGSAALSWANRDVAPGDPPRPATLVQWVWPVARQQQAPDLFSFRLYYRHGLLNAFVGKILAVTHLGEDLFRVQTDLAPAGPDFPTPPAPVDLGTLGNEGEAFPIETLTTVSGSLQFEVRASPLAPPIPGRCTFRLGAGIPAGADTPALDPYPAYRAYREASDWGGLVLEAEAPGPHLPLSILADGTIGAPLPAGLGPGDVEVSVSVEPSDEGSHLHYALRLRGLVLQPTRDLPRAAGSFAMTSVDDATPGNEGRTSPPAGVFAVHRQPPDVPELNFPDEIFASPADYYGRSYFELEWLAERDVGYVIYRTSDAELLDTAGISMTDHRALTPGQQRQQLVELGSRVANIEAFNAVTAEPVVATSDGPLSYRDELEGTVQNRFVYRLRAIDQADNLAPWPPDPAPADAAKVCVVVSLPPVTPPAPPRWSGSEPLDTGLALRWNPNVEAELAGYRLYRAYDSEAASDVRSMTPLFSAALPEDAPEISAVRVRPLDGASGIVVELLPAGDRTTGRLLQFVDGEVEGARPYYYRLVAEDRFGNRSLPSDLLTGQYPKLRPPEPPEWDNPIISTDEVLLTWSAAEDDLRSLVLRRQPGSLLWRPLGTWNPSGAYTFVDAAVEAGITYEYKIRVRDRVGHVVEGPVLVVST